MTATVLRLFQCKMFRLRRAAYPLFLSSSYSLSLILFRSFRIDKHPVTNDHFAAFVADSGYVTEAEKFQWSFVLE